MFNPYLQNQGLAEVGKGNFTAMEFTMLYLLNNDVQLNDGDTIQRHNAYFMEKLNLSLSQVQRIMKSLSEKGYITIERVGTKRNRKANIIRLIDVSSINRMDDTPSVFGRMNDRMDDTPQITCKKTYNNSRQVSSQTSTGTCEKKSEKKMEKELREERTYSSKENNAYVDKCLRRFDTMLHYLYTIKDCKVYDSYTNDILRFYESIDQSRFTEKQRGLITKKCEAWVKIADGKELFFNGKSENTEDKSISMEPEYEEYADAEPISMDDHTETDRFTLSQSEEKNPPQVAPLPPLKKGCRNFLYEEAIEWVKSTLPNYENYESWETSITEKFNRKYGVGWDCGKDPNACRLWNIAMRYASNHYYELEETVSVTGDDLAPWEDSINSNKNFTPAEAVEHLKAKCAL